LLRLSKAQWPRENFEGLARLRRNNAQNRQQPAAEHVSNVDRFLEILLRLTVPFHTPVGSENSIASF